MNSVNYLNKVAPQQEFARVQMSMKESLLCKIHEHPTAANVMKIGLFILGVLLAASLPAGVSLLGISVTVIAAGAVLTLLGAVMLTVAYLAKRYLDIAAPPKYDMSVHTFKTGEYGESQLFYHGDVPILTLNMDNPFQAGRAHGYLAGKAISEILDRLDKARELNAFLGRYQLAREEQVPTVLEDIRERIWQRAPDFMEELVGIVEGHNEWRKELPSRKRPQPITINQLILLNLMADNFHFDPLKVEKNQPEEVGVEEEPSVLDPQVACTVVIDGNQEELFMGRNLDWHTMGLSYDILIKRVGGDQIATTGVSFPGVIGTLTGMNKEGLALAMNVCRGKSDDERSEEESFGRTYGLPAVLYNRLCLESCGSVEGVEEFINDNPPFGSYHISVSDAENNAKVFHLYQEERSKESSPHKVRVFNKTEPLIVTNKREDNSKHLLWSEERENALKKFFEHAKAHIDEGQMKKRNIVEHSLGLPFVNNMFTAQKIMLFPKRRSLSVCFDTAYAGDKSLHEVPSDVLFEHGT